VYMMVPRTLKNRAPLVDVVSAMDEQPRSRAVSLNMLPAPPASATLPSVQDDPFAEVEV
jgi:hypothetical protein